MSADYKNIPIAVMEWRVVIFVVVYFLLMLRIGLCNLRSSTLHAARIVCRSPNRLHFKFESQLNPLSDGKFYIVHRKITDPMIYR
jgi:hypothetical protein